MDENHPLARMEPLMGRLATSSTRDSVTFSGTHRAVTFRLIPDSSVLKCTEYDHYGNDLSQKIFRVSQLKRALAWATPLLDGQAASQQPI